MERSITSIGAPVGVDVHKLRCKVVGLQQGPNPGVQADGQRAGGVVGALRVWSFQAGLPQRDDRCGCQVSALEQEARGSHRSTETVS